MFINIHSNQTFLWIHSALCTIITHANLETILRTEAMAACNAMMEPREVVNFKAKLKTEGNGTGLLTRGFSVS